MAIQVKAIRKGWYGTLREVGAEFTVKSEKDIGSWMKPVDAKEAKQDGAPTAKELIAAVNESEDVEFLTSQLESEFTTVVKAAEKRITELQG